MTYGDALVWGKTLRSGSSFTTEFCSKTRAFPWNVTHVMMSFLYGTITLCTCCCSGPSPSTCCYSGPSPRKHHLLISASIRPGNRKISYLKSDWILGNSMPHMRVGCRPWRKSQPGGSCVVLLNANICKVANLPPWDPSFALGTPPHPWILFLWAVSSQKGCYSPSKWLSLISSFAKYFKNIFWMRVWPREQSPKSYPK